MKSLTGYNDYVNTTRGWLKRYNQFVVTAENMRDEIAANKKIMEADVSAPCAKYGDEPGGGTSELNTVEAAASRHEYLNQRIAEAQSTIDEIERILRTINRTIDGLPKDDGKLIRDHYIDRKSWRDISNEVYLTEKWARDRGNKAIKEMAKMIFGIKAMPPDQQSLFIFSI